MSIFQVLKPRDPRDTDGTVNPNGNIGLVLSPENQGYPTSARFVQALCAGNYNDIKDTPPQWFINVQDDAKLHVIALIDPEVRFERVFGTTGPFTFQDLIDCLRAIYPERRFEDWHDERRDLSYFEPTKTAEQLLNAAYGHGYTSLSDSVRDNAKGL